MHILDLEKRKFDWHLEDELGGQFAFHKRDKQIEHSVPFGRLAIGFDKNDRIVDIEIYESAKKVIGNPRPENGGEEDGKIVKEVK